MLAGAFADAERAADRALELARMLGEPAEPEAIHALDARHDLRQGGRPEAAPDMLREAQRRAEALGLAEERWRATATSRPSWSCSAARRTRSTPRSRASAGLGTTIWAPCTATCLRATSRACSWRSAGGRARELSLRALDWSGHPVRRGDPQPRDRRDRHRGGRGGGPPARPDLVELETGQDLQFAVPAAWATAAYAMWSGDLADARRAAERGWARLRGTEDWVLVARMASTALEVESMIVADARDRRRIGDVAASREQSNRILAEAEATVARVREEG
ncbi:MAG: hypothetical protein U0838_13280 [Chloroflexota bacterium]